MTRVATVAVPVPHVDPLTYVVPEGFHPVRGARVLVPLGGRVVTGCVLELRGRRDDDPARLRNIIELLDADPFLPAAVLDTAAWVAEYYQSAFGDALATAAPPFAWMASRRAVRLTAAGRAGRDAPPAGLWASDDALLRTAVLDRLARGPQRRSAIVKQAAKAAASDRQGGERRVEGALRALEREGLIAPDTALEGRSQAFRMARVATVTASGRDDAVDAALGRRQREVLRRLRETLTGVDTAMLGTAGASSVIARLVEKGLVKVEKVRVERTPCENDGRALVSDPAVILTTEQRAALDALEALSDSGAFRVALLHGVTGSGKTEVYRRLAGRTVDRGRGVLILVPEIALTPAVAATFRRTFGERVAIQHSGLSPGERHDQWHRIRAGDVDVVVGTRSAVFAPLATPGLIIVDEEHDTSYKQEETPRYHGRDVAIVRARAAGALVVLGSATPSLESFNNAETGRYARIVMRRRVADRPLATVRIVDMRAEFAAQGPDVVLSTVLQQALTARVAAGEQAIVLLNRRGYATSIVCRECGATLECPNCSVSLTIHRASGLARCHYCDHSIRVPESCSTCGGAFLELTGFGTERVEGEIQRLLPSARVARVDRDTIRRRGELVRLLARFGAQEIDVLVGTQMIAKGHDFPAVTLVGVISADVGLGLADFRAAERTFQLLTQVAGRAGRGDRAGEAIIQTLYPGHYSIEYACVQDYDAFFARELRYRQAMRYPPLVALVNVIVRGPSLSEATSDARTLIQTMQPLAKGVAVVGPARAPLARLRGEHRAQFFLKGVSRRTMHDAIARALTAHPRLARKVTVDVDPLSVL